MTYNLRGPWDRGENAWENRREAVAQLIRQEAPDILGTQEGMIDQLQFLAESLPDYQWIGVGRGDGKEEDEFCAIFFRGLELLHSGTFWLSETPHVPGSMSWDTACTRICTWAQFAGGLRVYNAHLDHISAKARLNGMRLILDHIGSHPGVLMGDWNEGEDGEVFELTAQAGFLDTFRAIHRSETQVATYTNFEPLAVEGPKIDYIQVRGFWEVSDSRIVRTLIAGRQPSDHFPVTARVALQN
jgi:endonuclease/exonuclease/phosphatase family metal-dependent hydrolase